MGPFNLTNYTMDRNSIIGSLGVQQIPVSFKI